MWPRPRSTSRPLPRTRWRFVPVAGLAALTLVTGSASTAPAAGRAGAGVTVANFAFTPPHVRVAPGGTVTWTFPETAMSHTTTSDQGFWSSGPRKGGATFARTFATAGAFPYHCNIHPFMHGSVTVPLTATGSPSRGWRLTWARAMPAGYSVDVQVRKPGSSRWVALRSRTTRLGTSYHPARPGSYGVRARSHLKAHVSSWTPVRTIKVS